MKRLSGPHYSPARHSLRPARERSGPRPPAPVGNGKRDAVRQTSHDKHTSRAGFTKPCALLKLDSLTSAYKKCMR